MSANVTWETRKKILEQIERRLQEQPAGELRYMNGDSMGSSYDAHDATKKAMASGSAIDHAAAAQQHTNAAAALEKNAAMHRKAAAQHSALADPQHPASVDQLPG
jgi:hypothetical protein